MDRVKAKFKVGEMVCVVGSFKKAFNGRYVPIFEAKISNGSPVYKLNDGFSVWWPECELEAEPCAQEQLLTAANDRIAGLEAERDELKKNSFHHGYLIATANIVNLHGEDIIAGDVLNELGLTEGIIKKLDLSDYDAKPLRRLFREISRKRRLNISRKRKAISEEPSK